MSGKDIISILKRLEIRQGTLKSESFDWLFCYTHTNNIFTWLCRYVNENNIETDQDLYLAEKIQENNTFYKGIEFNEKFNQINYEYPGIFDINLDEITKLERKLAIEEEKEKSLENLSTNYLTLDYKIQQQLGKLERKEVNLKSELEVVKNNCLLRSKEIDEEHEEIQKFVIVISTVLNNFNNPVSENNFISQMNINTLKQQDEINKTYLNLWIERRFGLNEAFNIMTPSKSFNNKNIILSNAKEYYRINESLYNSLVERITAECNCVEINATKKYLEEKCGINTSYQSLDPEQNVKKVQLMHNINAYMEEFDVLVTMELESTVRKYIENLINSALSVKAKEKYNKCCKLLDKMKMLDTFVLQEFCENYLLDLLFKSEKRKLETSIKVLSKAERYLISQKQEVGDVNHLMESFEHDRQLYEQTPLIEREPIISDFLKVASGDFKTTEIKNVLSNVQKRDALLGHLKEQISNSENVENSEIITKVEHKIKRMKENLWHGPTMQPSIIPYTFIENMYELEHYLEKSKENLNRVSKTYKELQSYFNIRWNKEKKLLPVWFLTEPKKLVSVIQKIEEYVVNKSTKQDILVPEGKLLDL